MAEVKLELGAKLDMLSPTEHAKHLNDSSYAGWFREMARGLKTTRPPVLEGTVAAGVVTLGADQPDAPVWGPREGFVWAVQRISVWGDTPATDVVSVWRGAPGRGTGFVARIALSGGVYHPGSKALLLHPGEQLSFSGASLASAAIVVTGEVLEVPGPLIWKLID